MRAEKGDPSRGGHALIAWIWLFEPFNFAWASEGALKFWDATSLGELQARDWRKTTPEAVRLRLLDYERRLRLGERIVEPWTFYPANQPCTVVMACRAWRRPGRPFGMYAEARTAPLACDHGALRAAEALSRLSTPVGLFDAEGRPLLRNAAMIRLAGTDPRRLDELFAESAARRQVAHALEHRTPLVCEALIDGRQGRGWFQIMGNWQRDPATGRHLLLVEAHDIGRHRAERVRLEQLARYDPLTGAASRAHFIELCQLAISEARRHDRALAVLLADLDRFKAINDTYGHQAGDAVLREFVAVCRTVIRDTDAVGRIGGEEFAFLLRDAPPALARKVAERLRRAVRRVAPLPQLPRGQVTASFGLAAWQHGEAGIEPVLARADRALYRAKALGRDRVCVDEGARERAA